LNTPSCRRSRKVTEIDAGGFWKSSQHPGASQAPQVDPQAFAGLEMLTVGNSKLPGWKPQELRPQTVCEHQFPQPCVYLFNKFKVIHSFMDKCRVIPFSV
jgi:hypothetical protein